MSISWIFLSVMNTSIVFENVLNIAFFVFLVSTNLTICVTLVTACFTQNLRLNQNFRPLVKVSWYIWSYIGKLHFYQARSTLTSWICIILHAEFDFHGFEPYFIEKTRKPKNQQISEKSKKDIWSEPVVVVLMDCKIFYDQTSLQERFI